MQAKAHHIKTEISARYHSIGNEETPEVIWIVLHGYSQLGEFFIRKFVALDLSKTLVIAPDGLHRFYTSGHSGRVGASWMTKDDRENDINNYVQFLDNLYAHLHNKHPESKVIILGFSQGAATASRWVNLGIHLPNRLVLWGSVFPPDMELEVARNKMKAVKPVLVFGNSDEFTSKDKFDEYCRKFRGDKIEFSVMEYQDGHDIEPNTLLELEKRMIFD